MEEKKERKKWKKKKWKRIRREEHIKIYYAFSLLCFKEKYIP